VAAYLCLTTTLGGGGCRLVLLSLPHLQAPSSSTLQPRPLQPVHVAGRGRKRVRVEDVQEQPQEEAGGYAGVGKKSKVTGQGMVLDGDDGTEGAGGLACMCYFVACCARVPNVCLTTTSVPCVPADWDTWRSYYKAAARFTDALEAEASTLRQQLATHPQLLPRYLLVRGA
jgi:hypothetical protein